MDKASSRASSDTMAEPSALVDQEKVLHREDSKNIEKQEAAEQPAELRPISPPAAARRRTISVAEPPRHQRSTSLNLGRPGNSLGPAASTASSVFPSYHLQFSLGGPSSKLRKYASEGTAMGQFHLYPREDPRARRGMPGLFSLVQREDAHADDHGYHTIDDESVQEPEIDPDLVVFEGPDDPLNPQNWSSRKKYAQTLLLGISTLVVTFASSVFSSGTQQIAAEYGVGSVVATLTTSFFICGYALGPIMFGPLSEFQGRKLPLCAGYFLFAIFQIPAAAAQNLATIMICRFLSGTFASAPLAIVAGALADFWEAEKRGGAIGIFALATFGGPALGPIIGSYVTNSYLGWRWTAWLTLIWGMVMWILLVLFQEESFVPILLSRKAKKLRYETKNWAIHSKLDEKKFDAKVILKTYFARPFEMLIFEPMLLALTIYISFVYGILYLLFGAVPLEMVQHRGLSAGVGSLVFIAVFIGACVGILTARAFIPRYNRKMHQLKAVSVPEERMIPMMIGAVVFPVGFFMFGWTSSEVVDSIWGQVIALVLIGCGIVLLFLQSINYIVDAYLMHANSAIAGNTFVRSFFGAGFPLFAIAMFNNLSVRWASSLLGFLALALLPIPFLFFLYGKKLRAKSRFAFG